MLLGGRSHLALERHAEVWLCRYQAVADWPWAGGESLNSKAHVLKGGVIGLHDVLGSCMLAYRDACT